MQRTAYTGMSKGLSLMIIPLLLCLAWPGIAQAQYKLKPLAIGALSSKYSQIGGETEGYSSGYEMRWPAIWQTGVMRANAVWIAAENVKGADGVTYPYRVVHVGSRPTGAGEYFPVDFKTISKFEPPLIEVVDQYGDVVRTFQDDPDNDGIDPNLPADRMVLTKASTLLGITLTRRNYAFSDPDNDNYHIQEYVLTNTGDADGDLTTKELDQTLEGVYLNLQRRYTFGDKLEIPTTGGGWGANVMNDVIGDGLNDDLGQDFKASYTWLGNFPNDNVNDLDDYGLPIWGSHSWSQPVDTFGRLSETQFIGIVTLQAPDGVDGSVQPKTTGTLNADDNLLKNNSAFNQDMMQQEYLQLITTGHTQPQAWDKDADGNFLTPDGDPQSGAQGGWQQKISYGPYTLAPGDSVVIWVAEAVDGLTMNEAAAIGRKFKQLAGHDKAKASTASGLALQPNITYRGVTMGKNQWYFSGRDSLFDTFDQILDVFGTSNGMTEYPILEPPRPPSHFKVASGAGRISIDWEFAEGAPANGVELYRTESYIEGRLRFDGDSDPTNDPYFDYVCIATSSPTPSERCATDGAATISAPGHYEDTDVTRGVDYYYYIQAVGADGQKSSRYWTQTYDPALKLREPAAETSAFRVVPNPFNISAEEGVRYPGGKREKIGFLDIPGQSTIRVYTEKGELVKTIEHTTGTGDEYWDITTDSQQYLVSGLYIVAVTNNDTGESVIKKFVVIR